MSSGILLISFQKNTHEILDNNIIKSINIKSITILLRADSLEDNQIKIVLTNVHVHISN